MHQSRKRRTPAGTAAAAQEASAQAAEGWPEPPEYFNEAECTQWWRIMLARLPQSWAAIDLEHAANLARCFAAIHAHEAALRNEGEIRGQGDAKYINPRCAQIDRLNRRAMSLTRILQLHAVPTVGARKQQAGEKAEAAAAAERLQKVSAPTAQFNVGDLLARPRLQ